MQRFDRTLLTHRSGQEQERHLWRDLQRDLQRLHAVELRQREIGQDDVGRELLQRIPQLRFGLDVAPLAAQTRARQVVPRTLDVEVVILDEQHAERLSLIVKHWYLESS